MAGGPVSPLNRGERLSVAAPALVETYAVLTRLPAPHRLAPSDAWVLVKRNFVVQAAVVTLSGPAHVKLLGRLAREGDCRRADLRCAHRHMRRPGQGETLLTFNPWHFDPSPKGVAVIEPNDTE